MKKLMIVLLLLSTFLFSKDIKVAVAANVGFVIDELKKEFSKINQVKVVTILGSSGKLASKIKNSAPYDLFISADMNYPQALCKDGFCSTKSVIYAQGSLILFTTKDFDLKDGIEVILKDRVKRVVMGNTITVPYGIATQEVLKKLGIEDKIKSKLIYAESIAQAASYVVRAADIGFLAKSSLYSKSFLQYKENINWIEVDKKLYSPINQGIIITKYGENKKDVKAFYDFLLSNKAKEIFKKYGYSVDE